MRGLVAAVALLFGTAALILCLHDSMAVRYEFEFASPLVLLAVLGVFAVERALGGQPVWRRARISSSGCATWGSISGWRFWRRRIGAGIFPLCGTLWRRRRRGVIPVWIIPMGF